MEVRVRVLLLILAALSLQGCALFHRKHDAAAEQAAADIEASPGERPVIEPQIERRKVKVPKIATKDFEGGIYYGILSIEDFGSNSEFGARLAYHLTEDFFLEGTFAQSRAGKTSYETLSGAATLLTDKQRDYRYYALSLGWDALPGEIFLGRNRAYNSALYIVGGVGSTRFAGDEHFTLNTGVGYRVLLTDWLAAHIDVQDHLFDTDLLGKNKTSHNIEAHFGITVFF